MALKAGQGWLARRSIAQAIDRRERIRTPKSPSHGQRRAIHVDDDHLTRDWKDPQGVGFFTYSDRKGRRGSSS